MVITLSKFLKRVTASLKTVSQNKAIRLIVSLVVLAFCLFYLFINVRNIYEELRNARFNIYFLGLSVLLTWFVNWMGALSWWMLLKAFGQEIGHLDSWKIHFQSAIAKYVPGFVWQYVGKMVLSTEMGVPAAVTGRILVWEFVQPVWTGLAIGLIFTPENLLAAWSIAGWAASLVNDAGIFLLTLWFVIVILRPGFLHGGLFRKLCSRPIYLFFSAIVVSIGWLLLGVSMWLGVEAFVPAAAPLPYAVFVYTISMVTGILMLPVPNGLGVREGISIFLLKVFIPAPIALLVAAIMRVQLIAGEFICLLFTHFLIQVIHKLGPKHGMIRNNPKGLLRNSDQRLE